jgi:AcrR family transcriptional regulator
MTSIDFETAHYVGPDGYLSGVSAAKKPADKPKTYPSVDERQRYSPEIRRRQIVAAAKVVLLPNPEATLEDVAAEAGVTRQLVSLYFPGGGTGPLYGAMFDEYLQDLPAILGDDLITQGRDPEKIRAAAEVVIGRLVDWVVDMGQAWVFYDSRERPGAGIAERWDRAFDITAQVLMDARGKSKNPDRLRAAIVSEMAGFNAVARRLLDGEISRADAEAVIVEGFVALYTVVLPALSA